MTINCLSAGAHVLNCNNCNHNCSCRYGFLSKSCNKYCNILECQNQAMQKFVNHIGIDALASVASVPINSAMNDEKSKIRAEYGTKLRDQESIFDEKVSLLLMPLYTIFKNYRDAFNIHVSYSLDK